MRPKPSHIPQCEFSVPAKTYCAGIGKAKGERRKTIKLQNIVSRGSDATLINKNLHYPIYLISSTKQLRSLIATLTATKDKPYTLYHFIVLLA